MVLLKRFFRVRDTSIFSELKRRMKERERAAKRAERESNAPQPVAANPADQAGTAANEDLLDPTVSIAPIDLS
jgi:hypothetical protein